MSESTASETTKTENSKNKIIMLMMLFMMFMTTMFLIYHTLSLKMIESANKPEISESQSSQVDALNKRLDELSQLVKVEEQVKQEVKAIVKAEEEQTVKQVDIKQVITSALDALVDTYTLGAIEQLGDSGIYEADVNGGPLYFSADGKIMLTGQAFNTETGFEYTEQFLAKRALSNKINAVEQAELPLMIVEPEAQSASATDEVIDKQVVEDSADKVELQKFPAELSILTGDVGAPIQVAVFTDPDCPFCRDFEKEADKLEGVEIANMLFPIEQLHPGATEAANKIWCAEDNQAAYTGYMSSAGRYSLPPANAECKAPLEQIQKAAARVGVRGTPTFLSMDGRVLEGYNGKAEFMKWVNAAN